MFWFQSRQVGGCREALHLKQIGRKQLDLRLFLKTLQIDLKIGVLLG